MKDMNLPRNSLLISHALLVYRLPENLSSCWLGMEKRIRKRFAKELKGLGNRVLFYLFKFHYGIALFMYSTTPLENN